MLVKLMIEGRRCESHHLGIECIGLSNSGYCSELTDTYGECADNYYTDGTINYIFYDISVYKVIKILYNHV